MRARELTTRVRPVALAVVMASLPAIATGQIVAHPTFPVATGARTIDVAATYAGIFFLRETSGSVLSVQRASLTTPWYPPAFVDAGAAGFPPVIAVDPTGGFTVTWKEGFDLFGRYLDTRGVPSSAAFQQSTGLAIGAARLGSVASGVAIVWAEIPTMEAPTLRAQIGPYRYDLDEYPQGFDVAVLPSGGCVVAWGADGTDDLVFAQLFDPQGLPLGVAMPLAVSDDFLVHGVAADPVSGAMALVGTRELGPLAHEIRVFRFGADGGALGPELVVDTTTAEVSDVVDATFPSVGFGFGGDLYVVWGDHTAGMAGIRARAFASDGTPFGPSVTVAPERPRLPVQTTVLPDGRFVNAWMTNATAYANVVSLCVPGSAICGDGVLVGACERCDDGAANDDAAPGACRTNCLPARCGDGVVDAGETCDDGDFDPCDGCTPTCQAEAPVTCGDGVAVPACGEQCDDGNQTLLDGCTPACRLERVPGGGAPKTECLTEWTVDNPTNVPPYDKRGGVSAKQRCVDDDPRCDHDGGIPGSCTFRVRVCGNNTDLADCEVPERLSSWSVARPSASQTAKHPWLAAIRASLSPTVPAAILGPSDPDVCSGMIAIAVPLRGEPGRYKPGSVKLQTRAESYDGRRDQDRLNLECWPAS